MSFAVLLAQNDDVWGFWRGPGSVAGEVVIIVGALCVVVAVIFVWAAFIRKPRRKRVHSYHSSPSEDGGLPRPHKRRSVFSRAFGKRRHRRRRGHGRERPANPTLAQVGGLPPERRGPPQSS